MDLLEHAWQMLDVINPSEGVRTVHFLHVQHFFEVFRKIQVHYNVSRCYVLTHQKHSHCQMLIDMCS